MKKSDWLLQGSTGSFTDLQRKIIMALQQDLKTACSSKICFKRCITFSKELRDRRFKHDVEDTMKWSGLLTQKLK